VPGKGATKKTHNTVRTRQKTLSICLATWGYIETIFPNCF